MDIARHRRVLVAFLSLTAAISGRAQTLYWDTDGDTAGLYQGSGNWDTSTANWSANINGNVGTQGWNNGNSSIAHFIYSGLVENFTVTLGQNITLGGITVDYTPNAITINGSHTLTLAGSATIESNAIGMLRIDSVIDGENGLTKTGDYGLLLNAANTYTGQTLVGDGDIIVSNASSLGATGAGNETILGPSFFGAVRLVSSATINETFKFNGYSLIGISQEFVNPENPDPPQVILAGPMVLISDGWLSGGNAESGTALTVSGVISETNADRNLRINNEVTLSGNNTFTGRVQVDGGSLLVSSFNNSGVAGALGAGDGLQLGYNNEGISSGSVVYTGGTATSNRTIQLEGDGTVVVENPGTSLTLTGVISEENESSDRSLEKAGPGTLILKGDNTFTGNANLTDGTLILGHNNAAGIGVESEIVVGGNGTAYDAQLSLLLENGVTLNRYVDVYNHNNDGGTTTLGMAGSGTATFAEEVYITRSIDLKVDAGGTLNFTEFFSDGSGGGSVTKTGNGKAVFSGGVDLRGGGFTVTGGELRLNSSVYLNNGIDVYNGAKLSGSGTITGGAVFVGSGGTLSPGDGAGALTLQSLYMSSGSHLAWQLAGLSTSDTEQFDRVLVNTTSEGHYMEIYNTATLTLDLALLSPSQRPDQVMALNDVFWQSQQTWLIVDFSGPGSNNYGAGGQLNPFSLTNGTFAGGVFKTFVGDGTGGFSVGDVFLQFTPVPEPSTWVLLGTGGALLLLVRRRRRA